MPHRAFYTPTRIATFIVVLTVILTLVMIPIDSQQRLPVLGEPAGNDIFAPSDLTFDSEVRTEQARQAARDAVEPTRTFDPGIRTAQVAALANLLEAIDDVRQDPLFTEAERTAALAALPELNVSGESQLRILGFTDLRWQTVKDRAVSALTDILTGNIQRSELQEIRDDIPNRVGTGLSRQQTDVLADLIAPLIEANIAIDDDATAIARRDAAADVEAVSRTVLAGDLIIRQDAQVDTATLEVLDRVPVRRAGIPGDELIAVLILALAGAITLGLYLVIATPDAAASNRRLVLVGVLVVAAVAAARWYTPLVLPSETDKYLELILPLATAAVLVAALLERTLALIVAAVVAVLAGSAALINPDFAPGEAPAAAQALRPLVVLLFAAVAGIFATQRVERLTQYGVAGLVVGATTFLVGLAFWLLDPDRGTIDVAWLALVSLIVAVSTSVLTIGAMTTLGLLFGITTRLQLLELAQLTQPLLRRLQEEAPGTFHHCLLVATMGERAATQIDADALLVRVGAYYHDIGKLAQPHMYIENQADGSNPHDSLDPKESAVLIQDHVYRGIELARQERLPLQVRAFVPEHHGTRLVTYFYRKAARLDPQVDPAAFTYDGPRPQSRETAIVMMADSCEAVVRSSQQRDLDTIDRLIDAVINERLAEHQFDDCDLTLRQLRTIGESFKVTLRGVYHPRIEYPEPTADEQRRTRRGARHNVSAAPQPVGQAPVDGSDLPVLPDPSDDSRPTGPSDTA